MLVVPSFTRNVAVVMVEESMASEKVAVIAVFTATSVALLAGLVEETIGAVVSDVAPVVNDQVYSAPRAFPAKSLASVVKVAVYSVS